MTRGLALRLVPAAAVPVCQLADLFAALAEAGDEGYFHTHPLTREAAAQIVGYQGKDVYVVAVAGDELAGYGMLRGWDEGYEVPSLGLAVAPEQRGIGVGAWLTGALHDIARTRGADRVRLTVSDDNEPARRLYERLGYEFSHLRDGVDIGYCLLDFPSQVEPSRTWAD